MAAALFCVGNVSAQNNEFSDPFATPQKSASSASDRFLFNHLGAGVSIGLDGIGVELATPVTPYLGLRAGVSFFPKINVNVDDIDYTRNGKDGKGEAKAKLNKFDGKVLLDVYPFGNKLSVHVTGGLFIGGSNLITASFIEDSNAPIGAGISKKYNWGTPDQEQWVVKATSNSIDLRLRTNSIKPYIGIGFGRMVPKPNKRVGVACDLGVQFHGKPKLEGYATLTPGDSQHRWEELNAENFDFGEDFHKDVEDALDIIHKVNVWPVLNIRITGRIF